VAAIQHKSEMEEEEKREEHGQRRPFT
jgi:hypothetical protein